MRVNFASKVIRRVGAVGTKFNCSPLYRTVVLKAWVGTSFWEGDTKSWMPPSRNQALGAAIMEWGCQVAIHSFLEANLIGHNGAYF